MSTGAVIAIIVVVLAVLAASAVLARLELRRRHLRARFGPEYERALAERQGRRAAAEQELAEREKRFAALDLRPISATSRERHAKNWALLQALFVDRPGHAVDEADRFVITVMSEAGYPTEDYRERLAVLSVRHGRVLDRYRTAHDIKERHEQSQVSTEELRSAILHYRALVEELLAAEPPVGPAARPDRKTTSADRAAAINAGRTADSTHTSADRTADSTDTGTDRTVVPSV